MSKRRAWAKYDYDIRETLPEVPVWFASEMPYPWDGYLWHQWLSAWAEVMLSVCNNVWRKQGAKLYAAHKDMELKADLKDWLIVKAMEAATHFVPDPWHPEPHLQFAKYLTVALTDQARYHFSEMVGSGKKDAASGLAAREAYHAGMVSTDSLDEREAETGRVITRHPLHGHDLMVVDPLAVLIRMEELNGEISRIEREDRREPWSMPKGQPCLINLCTQPAWRRGLCGNHERAERQQWAVERGHVCQIPDCGKPHFTRGLCSAHNQHHLRGTLPDELKQFMRAPRPPKPETPPICTMEDCGQEVYARGLCRRHHRQDQKVNGPRCEIPGCDKLRDARGMCNMHYLRWRKERAGRHG